MTRTRTTTRRRWLYVSSVGVLGLAGCLDDGADIAEDNGSSEAPDLEFPPGLSSTGVEAPETLLEAHRSEVAAASFHSEHEWQRTTRGDGDQNVRAASSTIHAEPSAERVKRTSREGYDGSGTEQAIYIDGDRGAASDGDTVGRLTADDVIDDALEALEVWMLEAIDDYHGTQSTDAGPVHEFSVSGAQIQTAFGGDTERQFEGSGTVLVDEDGRIHEYQTRQTGTVTAETDGMDDMEVELEINVEFGGFGATAVAEPSWVDDLLPVGNPDVTIEPGTRIALDGQTAGWEGVEPSAIEGLVNPTLVLEAGEPYEIGWSTGDGQLHNIELRTETDDVVDGYETPLVDEPGPDQWLEFVATSEISTYACAPHETSMRGSIEVR
ncbi:hypothetical protein [Natronorubrum sp. A-ect3]|uniref:hypothetical protein n=1 Tax=Natronorubrum sp. A-ect3 TaxID=3242698 RepID=UPI00359EF552